MKLTQEQRENLDAKVKKHSTKRKEFNRKGNKRAAAFHEGCSKYWKNLFNWLICRRNKC